MKNFKLKMFHQIKKILIYLLFTFCLQTFSINTLLGQIRTHEITGKATSAKDNKALPVLFNF